MNAKRLLSRLGLVLGGLVLGLLAAEGLGRLDRFTRGRELLFPNLDGYPQDLYVAFQDMNYPNPEFKGVVSSFGYRVRPRFNAWGTRGPEPAASPPCRWITAGDSVTLALQVEPEDTFSELLATKLGCEVLNSGVDGYSTWKETIRTAQLATNLPSKGVVVTFFTGNDFRDNRMRLHSLSSTNLGSYPRPGGPKLPVHAVPPRPKTPAYQRWLHDHSVVWAWFTVWQKQRATRAGTDPGAKHFKDELEIFTRKAPQVIGNELAPTRQALADLRATADRIGIDVVLAVIPPAFAMSEATAAHTLEAFGLDQGADLQTAQAAVLGAARDAGLPTCDMAGPLRAAAEGGAHPYLVFDGHLSAAGHEVVADELARCIGSLSP